MSSSPHHSSSIWTCHRQQQQQQQRQPSLSLPPPSHQSTERDRQTQQLQSANEPAGRILFTRHLWQRNSMPDGNQKHYSRHFQTELNDRSQARNTNIVAVAASGSSRRTSSATSSQRSSGSATRLSSSPSPTPLAPEEILPFTRKRTAGIIDDENKQFMERAFGGTGSAETAEVEPPPNWQGSGSDSGIHVCICQPDPKIPRPRNAFILYRQHHQASVIAQNPGLANPEISKIIGEQWQNQAPEVKNKWKALAEEEKIRHQQQYPTYRYQPKRNGRRNSVTSETGEKPSCPKCGGRSILSASTPSSSIHPSGPGPRTPASARSPVSHTLPVFQDLNLQSPTTHRMGISISGSNMSPCHHLDERDDLGPLSPDFKRRRFNGDPPVQFTRSIPQRYVNVPHGPHAQPGTPFPFGQKPAHPYLPVASHVRRDGLPGLRRAVNSPGPMGPPPRPGPGYQQHRLSQGNVPHDRSLTLPPLQTARNPNAPSALATGGASKSAKEQIMNMDFRNKVHVLRRVAPPVPVLKNAPRGPLVAIEGDNFDAVKELGVWLAETLRKGDGLHVSLLEPLQVFSEGSKEALMAQYHRLAAEWLKRSIEIRAYLAMSVTSPTDSVVILDSMPASTPRKPSSDIDENYDESEHSSSNAQQTIEAGPDVSDDAGKSERVSSGTETMEIDDDNTSKPSPSTSSKDMMTLLTATSAKPVSIIANYSLHASNFFARNIPIDAHDPYAPNDHWQWTATQWRGIISPDLTIYVLDAATADSGKQSVDILDEGNLFVVKRTKSDDWKERLDIDPSTLRRLGFEVSEWVREFGTGTE